MILVDSSVWIDCPQRADEVLVDLLNRTLVAMHPFIMAGLALGHLQPRDVVLNALEDLDRVVVAHDDEVMRLIDQERFFGLGLGYVDAQLFGCRG